MYGEKKPVRPHYYTQNYRKRRDIDSEREKPFAPIGKMALKLKFCLVNFPQPFGPIPIKVQKFLTSQ